MTGGPSKIAGPLGRKVTDEDGDWDTVPTAPDDRLELYIRAEPGRTSEAIAAIEGRGLEVRSEDNGYIAVDVPALKVTALADEDAIRHIQERRDPRSHTVDQKYITEGEPIVNADDLQSDGITGSGATIAVIDHEFHTENPKYKDRIKATVGDSTYFTTSAEHDGTSQHGTACAEIVADLAPDAELVLATTRGSKSFSQIMTEIESYDPDAATMSLGFYWGLRIDGEDPISDRVSQFTDDGRLFVTSAGNEATYGHWDGQFTDDGNGLMVFDSDLPEPTRYPVYMDTGGEVIAHWDADWTQDDQRYELRLYDSRTATTAIDTSRTTDPYEVVTLTSGDDNTDGYGWYYVEIENINATGTEHFDLFNWGLVYFDCQIRDSNCWSTPERSLGIPATSPDEDTLAVAAVQATGTGLTSEEHLKPYSSQGPTQDGRNALDIAAPSMVSTTAPADYGGYDTLESGGGFNGTSAAAPHMGGVFGLLFDSAVDATHTEVRDAVFATGTGIADPDVSAPGANNTKIGYGYADALDAREELVALDPPLSTKWTSNDLGGRAQFNRPAVDSQQVYVGGLQNTFYALSRSDGTSIGWTLDRGPKTGLSDSSGYRYSDQVFFGSGQGKLFGVDADDATRHWSSSDTPELDSAITSSPVVVDDVVYAGTNDGRVLAYDYATAGKQWEASVGGAVYSHLRCDGTNVYVTTRDGDLVVLDAGTGAEQWRASFPSFGNASPVLGDGRVYVAADEVHAFDASSTKNSQWSSSGYGGTAGSSPAYVSGAVIVGSADGSVYKLDASTGSITWTFPTGGPVAGAPGVNADGTRIAVASTDGTLYLLDGSGTNLQEITIPSDSRSTPVIDNGELFVGSRDGTVYAFE